jgi:transcriptional regulator with XRE-family HTH domain
MPSGRKPNLRRRRQAFQLRDQGLTLSDIAHRLGVTRQAIWAILQKRPCVTQIRTVPCTNCGAAIVSPALLAREAARVHCLNCLANGIEVSFGQRLRGLRLARGLTQTDLWRRTGITPGSLRAYEDDLRHPQRQTLKLLVSVLGPGLLPHGPLPVAAACQGYSDAS